MGKYFQKNWMIKLVCFIAAFGLWIYIINIENPLRTINLVVPVTVINMDTLAQSNLTIVPNQNFSVTLTIRGSITDLQDVSNKKNKFKVVADMSEYRFKKGENNVLVELKDRPANQGIQILNNETLFIKINLDDLVEKTFHIVPSLEGKVKSGYIAQTPIVKPTDVVISGAKQYVDTVTSVVANGTMQGASSDLDLVCPLKAVNSVNGEVKEVKIDKSTAEVLVPVKKTKTVSVNLKTKGALSQNILLKQITTNPTKVDIAGNADVIDSINSLDTEPVDLSSFNDGKTVNAKLIVPQNVTLINSDGTVAVSASVDKITTKTLQFDVSFSNVAAGFAATVDPATNPNLVPFKETVAVTGASSVLDSLNPANITCVVDMTGVTQEGTYDKTVTVNTPSGVTATLNYSSIKVAFKKQ